MGCAARPDCWYQCDIPAYRPRTGDMAARVSGTGPGLVPRPRPSSEKRGVWLKVTIVRQDTE